MWTYNGWNGGPWMMIFPALFLVLCFVMIAFFMRGGMRSGCGLSGHPKSGVPGDDARAILNARYARGEISREDWEQMRKDVGQ